MPGESLRPSEFLVTAIAHQEAAVRDGNHLPETVVGVGRLYWIDRLSTCWWWGVVRSWRSGLDGFGCDQNLADRRGALMLIGVFM